MTKFAKRNNLNFFFLIFLPDYLLIIHYYLTKFEAHSCYSIWDIKFSMSKFAKGNN